ncbi:putative ATP-dependent RNA helicase DDX20 [Araneus ventricosus]|uniref:RNA helicase n=1 Tax=Araneus ventricosus TaxID=182803 RepID=A0A4Y2G794_ARAVE|nr:putative ATP-dependent RNA helicase DDX20 [Araneus ventricosus]
MSGGPAHILEQKWRSDDIRIGEDADFSSLLLPKEILSGLTASGFKYPSPIQLKAIPVGKIGKDLIVQAKSGTGKTLVFTVVALNMLLKGATHPQVLIMAPTREIACQICQVIKCVGSAYKGLACEYFIGGRILEEDVPRIQGCQVIVGTPGRIKHLINYKILKTAGIRLFVLDEADQLLKESSFTTDIDDIYRALPRDKQMIATSATYPDKLKRLTKKYFRDPLLIRLNKMDIGLLGMVHYYRIIPVSKLPVIAYKEKLLFLERVLISVKFAQCLVFCNMVSRVENLCVEIKKWGFATSYISSAREQQDRLIAIELLKRFKCKVLVSSDVSSRGIDAENVDLVINFDLPSQLDTYFHRVGRAGRYGSKCASVTFVTSDEIEAYQRMQTDGKFKSYPLPDLVPEGLISLQPNIKHSVKNGELPLDDGSESSSDSSCDIEDLNENGVVKQEKANGFSEDIELNGHNELSCTSKVEEFASENLTNLSDEKLVDIEVASTESRDTHEMQNQSLDLNSNPTNSVKEDDDLSSTSESVELELDKIDSPASVKLKQPEVVTEISSLSEIVAAEDENNLKVNESNGEESCENKLVERKLDQENLVSLEENTENCQPKSGNLASNIHGLQQITNTISCLLDLENDSKNSLKEKNIDGKSLVMNNEFNTSKNFNDPKSKELISSCITFIEKYENCNKGSEKFSTAVYAKSSESINVESNDNTFSPKSLKHYRSSLSQYHYDVRKDFIVNSSEDLTNEIAQVCGKEKSVNKVSEIEEQTCLKQNDGESKIQNSSLDSQLKLFSTPKVEVLSGVGSGDSSGLESNSGSDKDKLIQHFNLRLASIHKVKPSANKNSTSESSSDCESNLDTSINSEDAMHMLTEEFNKVSQERAKCYNKEAANIINYAESSSSSSSDSGTSIDSENAANELEQKFTELIKAKKSGGSSKDTEETKKILREIQSTKKCFKGIEIVDTKKHVESSTNSTSSDSDTSIDSGKAKDEPKKEFNKRIQNVKSKVVNTIKSSESSSYKTKTRNGQAENKITYYSETESDVDQYSKESPSGLQDAHQRKTCKKGKTVSKTDSGCRAKTVNGRVENKITYHSRTSSSEIENDIDQYSKESSSSLQIGRQRKSHKKNETVPKTEPSQFDYSNTNGTSNPYFNPACERPIFCPPHSHYQSNPYNRQYSQQRQNHADQGSFLGAHSNYQMQPTYYASNPYYPSYPQQIQSHTNDGQFLGTQSSYHMQPTYVPNPLSQPYPNECSLKESCQMSKMQLGSKPAGSGHAACFSIDNSNSLRNSNPSTNHVQSNYQMQPSHYAYNQCFAPSQHPCHPPNETCQSPACAAWYDIFYKQWQFLNQSPYF